MNKLNNKKYILKNEKKLLKKAKKLSGHTIIEILNKKKIKLSNNFYRDKGWIGKFLEKCLGATASNKAKPDFEKINIELKTIPVNRFGIPLQTTFVCMVSLINNIGITWKESTVRNKLRRVLWIPIETNSLIPILNRRIGNPLIWSPNNLEEKKLKKDWEELMEIIVQGKIEEITTKYGTFLQIQIKAINNKSFTTGVGRKGESIMTLPRGFYLKKIFTAHLLKKYFFTSCI